MSVRPVHALLAVLTGAVVMQGCYMTGKPGAVTNFLTAGNLKLANALKRAAADWARHGLEIANYVTVDDGLSGIAVQFVSKEKLKRACPDAALPGQTQWGCTFWLQGDWMGMYILDDLEEQPVNLSYIVQHEMIHALVPEAPHLERAPGIFTAGQTVNYVTRADMEHLARYTDVTESQTPFVEDAVATPV